MSLGITAAPPPCTLPVLILQDFPKNSSAVTVNFGSSSVDKWPWACAVIDFLITRHCGLQFSKSAPEADWPHPIAASLLCLLGHSAIHSLLPPSLFAFPPSFHSHPSLSLNAPAPSTLILSLPRSTLHYPPLHLPIYCHHSSFISCSLIPLPLFLHHTLSLSSPHIRVSLKTNGSVGRVPQRILNFFFFTVFILCMCVCESLPVWCCLC